jgi:hypothetical protein
MLAAQTIKAVPAGTGPLVWAASIVASSVQGKSIHVFIPTSQSFS